MGWRAVSDLVPHAAYITSEQYIGIMLLSLGSALCSLKTWFGTLVVEACTTENDRSLTSLNCMCGSVHGMHLLNTPRRNAIDLNARHIATRFTCTFIRTIQLYMPNFSMILQSHQPS